MNVDQIMKVERHKQEIESWCAKKGIKPEDLQVVHYSTIVKGEIALIGGVAGLGYSPRLAHNIG